MRNRTFLALSMAMVLTLLLVSTALAAQGQITEVNPSGVHGTIKEDVTEDEFHFVLPPPKRPDGLQLEIGLKVNFTEDCRGNHCFATGVTKQTSSSGTTSD